MLAESANTLVMFRDLNKKGFLHDTGAEHLVSGDQDWTPVPMRLGRHLDAVDRTKRDAACVYGWPVLVARNQRNYPVIAPFFLVSVGVEQRDSQWIAKAESEPEFNLSIVAGELFDMSAKEEIDALVGEGLPFGDAAALVHLARNIAGVLDVGVVSDLDPQSLHRQCDVAPGVYNAALWILANDGRGASQSLRDELDELARRQDWTATAAAYLVPDRPHPAEPRRCILDESAGRSAPVQRISGISPRPVPARTADNRYRSARHGEDATVYRTRFLGHTFALRGMA